MRPLILSFTLLISSVVLAQPPTAPTTAGTPVTPPARLSVAVLDFEANAPGNPDLGKQIAEALAARLADEPALTMVDRAALPRALQELELNLTGLADTATAVRVGHVVGAKLLVTGRAFVLDDHLHITAKIIGTETSLVDGVLVKSTGQQPHDVSALLEQLTTQLAARLKQAGPKLVAAEPRGDDPAATAVKRLAGRKLPVVAVRISEQLVGPSASQVDPAVQTEVTMLLKQAGFTVIEGDDRELARAKVQYVVTGEGLGEFAARIGNLVSCSARVEVKIVPLGGGEVLFADRETARAADLSQNLAGKAALQKAGRTIGIRVLEHFAKDARPATTRGSDE